MTFNTINIPTSAKREGETNDQAFNRIMSTWNGEYENRSCEFTYADLGAWVESYMERFKDNTFPCAWVEDDNNNIIEYYVFYWKKGQKWLKHETV